MATTKAETTGELAALGRIVSLIKAYRYQTDDDQILTPNQALDAYLKQRLSVNEWTLWQHLTNEERLTLRTPVVAQA